MATKLNIKDRKNTTVKALESLQDLVESFDGKFMADVNTVESNYFYAKIETNNDLPINDFNYHEWINYNAFWRIKDGELELVSVDNEDIFQNLEKPRTHVFKTDRYQQINFAKCIEAMESVIAKYNAETEKKDAQIEKFLAFCSEFKATK